MASYDLRCRSCGEEFEVFQLGFLKEDAKVCPACGGREVEQLFTGFGGVTGLDSGGANSSGGGRAECRSCSPTSGFS